MFIPVSQLVVKNVATSFRSRPKRTMDSSKILLSMFRDHRLATFAKCCTRVATCLVNMCPEDKMFSWPTFIEEIGIVDEGKGDKFVASLAEININPEIRE